ncbi:GGDEF domain-containing protein [Pseudidiomarina andamanensis]|uniref:diguanylate cyclase n=1 Tax=Pseudidiomarina andamanensis TaxID=1940690 RepID=A0AA92IL64_9GAMM|nr:GGDEF domain-containing protein [Pseudidiomarina andamanensis]MDS0218091.1 GGDEF domain-containing protein [Pseudidiomarina andamanensis]QGT94979.1 GGDEF domain-containing protein [Pseudidiomarina andamanensis]
MYRWKRLNTIRYLTLSIVLFGAFLGAPSTAQPQADDAHYQQQRILANQYYSDFNNAQAQEICRETPPKPDDFDYRFICVESLLDVDETTIELMYQFYADALEADRINDAARMLSSIGWAQASIGNISAAFAAYEQGLEFGDKIDFFVLNNLMLNTATLYIMYGDADYVAKGIQLHKETIERFKERKQSHPEDVAYADRAITLTHFNLGVANAFHVHKYDEALAWFEKVDINRIDLRKSTLIFSALAAHKTQQPELARSYLQQADAAPHSSEVDTQYLDCYRDWLLLNWGEISGLPNCERLSTKTPVEVKLDLYKRIAQHADDNIRIIGLDGLHKLFVNKLENSLKQSSTIAASNAELNRLTQESRLKSQLIENEKALKLAEQEKHESQVTLTFAITVILVMAVLLFALRLEKNRKLAQQFEQMSVHDALTGLYNRRYFEQQIGRELKLVKRAIEENNPYKLAIFVLDIDHFKSLNDTYGHDVGDKVLCEFSRRVESAIRETDVLVRWGGEEFVVVSRVDKNTAYQDIANRIRLAVISTPFAVNETEKITLTCTIGGIIFPFNTQSINTTWQTLVQLADAALYYGKETQRDCWVCIEHIETEEALQLALSEPLVKTLPHKSIQISRYND